MGIKAIETIGTGQEIKAIAERGAMSDSNMTLVAGGDQGLHLTKGTTNIPAEITGTIEIAKAILRNRKGDQYILPSHTHRNKHNKYSTGSDWLSETTRYNLMLNSYNY